MYKTSKADTDTRIPGIGVGDAVVGENVDGGDEGATEVVGATDTVGAAVDGSPPLVDGSAVGSVVDGEVGATGASVTGLSGLEVGRLGCSLGAQVGKL